MLLSITDRWRSKFENSNRSQNILISENGSIKIPNFYFAVRRILTLLFAIIKVQFNTLSFVRNLSKDFGPLQGILMCIFSYCQYKWSYSAMVARLTPDQNIMCSNPCGRIMFFFFVYFLLQFTKNDFIQSSVLSKIIKNNFSKCYYR